MKVIQSRKIFTDLSEARFHFGIMASKDGFIGGRPIRYYGGISIQVFFECGQAMGYDETCKGFEPVSLIPADKVSKNFTLLTF